MKSVAIIATIVVLLSLSQAGFAAEKNEFGVGIILGEPSGVNGRFFWSKNASVDVTAAWSWHDWFFTAADFQFHRYIPGAEREWTWTYGLGGYLTLPENEDGTLGLRVPLGLRYNIPHTQVDLWAEVAPALQLIKDTEPELQGGLGVTFWLK